MLKTTTSKLTLLGAVLIVILVVLPLLLSGKLYYMGVVTTAMALSIAAAGVWLTFYIGRINIGQGAFALIGGYASAILIMKGGLSFWLAMPLAGVVSAIIGVLIGFPILRLRGVYFAMITLSLTETARLSAQWMSSLTGGAKGIINIPLPGALEIFGITLVPDFSTIDSHLAFYYLAAVLLIATYAAMYRLVNSRIGWLFRSLQQNEDLASSIGVNIAMLRVIAFAISSFLAGVGGAFFVAVQQSVYPNTFQVQDSVYFMLYCFLGGLGYVFGPIVGTFVLFLSFEMLQGLNEYQPLVYSILMIALMLWLPNGLLSLGEGRRNKVSQPPAKSAEGNAKAEG